MMIFAVLFPHTGIIPFPFAYSIPVLLLIWTFLRYQKETFRNIGFRISEFGLKPILIGSIAGILLFFFLNWIFFPLLNTIFPLKPAKLDDFAFIRGNTGNYIFILIIGWIIGGVYEEIVFHGFIFSRLEKLINRRYSLLLSFFLTNIIFALYHLQLGTSGVINALVAGSVYHALMLYYKRNMWYAIICHGIFDTIALTYIYTGYW